MVHRANLGACLARHCGSALEHLRVVLVERVRLVDVPVNKLHRDSNIEPLARCLDTLMVADEVINAQLEALVVNLIGVCRDLEMAHILQRGENGCLELFGHRGDTSRRLRHT
eukprot:CAMPEP_0181192316 /NCGR_PEP_ID=MMETSP1096-20121128/13218_1 /TAXON_ID=156174 ORGANISM="Chrysochromulina ericina, Strain CCMP281" /NCGR_SAMPLE_ID=MMETSP1096 /ASSEMBLY_ACC=CAM_ASM_000453 /LENGTH=111 /DNA_ID=CAMNT_0023281703 /DNA_START=299 /DNA_END=630 /DNA_ORIENTATION=-